MIEMSRLAINFNLILMIELTFSHIQYS